MAFSHAVQNGHGNGTGGRYRESRLESAVNAEDIFDLYGADAEGSGSGRRGNWQSGHSGAVVPNTADPRHASQVSSRRGSGQSDRRASLGPPVLNGHSHDVQDSDSSTTRNGNRQHRLSQLPPRSSEVEELEDEAHTPGTTHSWDGPMAALSHRASGISIAESMTGNEPPTSSSRRSRESSVPLSIGSQPNGTYANGTGTNTTLSAPSSIRKPPPTVTVTPDMTPSRRGMTADKSHDGGEDSRRVSMLSSSTFTTDSPTPNRLTPRLSGVYANGSISQASFGSSQYPGEDADAFHVRSTYARLESEGVHGDGYLPGVERTRGGPSVGKRATMMEVQKGESVGEKERDFLSSLDRYGFINEPLRNRSETRLALIPTAPLLKVPKLPNSSPLAGQARVEPPPMGPGGGGGDAPQARTPGVRTEADYAGYKRKETERVEKWMRMMGVKRREGGNAVEWSWKDEGTSKLTRRVYKGIPDRWRMAAWWTLAESRIPEHHGKGKKKAEDLYMDYRNSIDLPSSFDVQIDLDVPRTISGHTLFVTRYGAGQRSLFHVLHCFAMLCDTCGYCQGMGPIAATLLCYFDPERVYALMVRMHDLYGMHEIFAPGFPGLLEAFYVQERLMEWLMPDIYKSFQKNMISSSSWGTKWYITLFVNTVPFSQQLRLWDALLLDGRDVMILTSVAILWAFKDLLAAPTATFESILSLLSSYFVAEDEDKLMRWIKRMMHQPGLKQKMDKWRVEWQGLVREGKDRDVLL